MKTYIVKGILPLLAIFIFGGIKVAAQCPELYGITFGGGEYGGGTLFKTDGNGDHLKTVHSFFRYEGLPEFLCMSGGKFYGLVTGWEITGGGSPGGIYEYDPLLGTYLRRITVSGADMGSGPVGAMTEGSHGNLIGMASGGESHHAGVIFEWDPSTNEYMKEFEFDGNEMGAGPIGSLLKAKNGKYYGVARSGGQYGHGVIFEWDADSNKYTRMYDFDGQNGESPSGTLLQADNGKLYGMTWYGGQYGMGVIYEMDPVTGYFTKKIDFNGADNGQYPKGSLIQTSSGKLYGVTSNGGVNGHSEGEQGWITDGVLFEWDPGTNILTKKFDFKFGANGYQPDGTLLKACGEKLYGRTSYGGGASNLGVLFEFDLTTDSMTKKLDIDEYNSLDAMIVTDSCAILGVSYRDIGSSGAFVEWDPLSNTFTDKLKFFMAENGVFPVGHLIAAENKKLYGMTHIGGIYNRGVLFEWNPASGAYSKKYDFEGSDNGESPDGSLVQANNGKLYGMTRYGGEYGKGVLFEWDLVTEVYNKKVDFNGEDMGGYPNGALIQAQNGKLYGMTPSGGEPDEWGQTKGVIFEWDPVTAIFAKKVNFDGPEKGSDPSPSLTEAPNGKLYGITRTGGRNDAGVLFEWDPDKELFTKRLDFSSDSGMQPTGSLILARNGKLYGITLAGGVHEEGVIFEWDPLTDTYSKKLDILHYPHEGRQYGSMVQSLNGKFYGLVIGIPMPREHGVLFEYDPVTDNYVEKTDTISGLNWYIVSDGLTSLRNSPADTIDVVSEESYISPSGRYTWNISGIYHDTIPSAGGCDSVLTINLTITYPTSLIITTFKQNITFYPNPTDGKFTIDLGKTYPGAEITITQLDGRIIHQEHITNTRFKDLQLTESPGLYLVSVTSGNERAVFKLSKK